MKLTRTQVEILRQDLQHAQGEVDRLKDQTHTQAYSYALGRRDQLQQVSITIGFECKQEWE